MDAVKIYLVVGRCENEQWIVAAYHDKQIAAEHAVKVRYESRRLSRELVGRPLVDPVNPFDPTTPVNRGTVYLVREAGLYRHIDKFLEAPIEDVVTQYD